MDGNSCIFQFPVTTNHNCVKNIQRVSGQFRDWTNSFVECGGLVVCWNTVFGEGYVWLWIGWVCGLILLCPKFPEEEPQDRPLLLVVLETVSQVYNKTVGDYMDLWYMVMSWAILTLDKCGFGEGFTIPVTAAYRCLWLRTLRLSGVVVCHSGSTLTQHWPYPGWKLTMPATTKVPDQHRRNLFRLISACRFTRSIIHPCLGLTSNPSMHNLRMCSYHDSKPYGICEQWLDPHYWMTHL